jgi:hypothetical protein
MFKWFAPLLLFAAKPEVAIGALAAAVLFAGVWLISNIAVTFETLKNPAIAAAYAAVLLLFFVLVGSAAWLRLRRLAAPARLAPPRAEPQALPLPADIVAQRAKELSGRWDAELKRSAREPAERLAVQAVEAAAKAPPPRPQARATLIVTGPAYTGKSALIAALADAASSPPPGDESELVRLVDAGASDGDERNVAALVAKAKVSDAVLFVVDQDLRAPEVAAITRLRAAGKPLYVLLNKSDQFTSADRDAILASIRAKMPRASVIAVAGAPLPVTREVEDVRGAVRLELRTPAADIAALTALLEAIVPPRGGRALRFEAA